MDEVCNLLEEPTAEKASQAVDIILSQKLFKDTYHIQRTLVKFPTVLDRYLKGCLREEKYITPSDFISMICRCAENTERGEDFGMASALVLLSYLELCPLEVMGKILHRPLLLLNKKHKIRSDVLEMAAQYDLRDKYYEAWQQGRTLKYTLPTWKEIQARGEYSGYRDAHHLLLYGGARRSELLERWKAGIDCTFNAACDFYQVSDETPQTEIEQLVLRDTKIDFWKPGELPVVMEAPPPDTGSLNDIESVEEPVAQALPMSSVQELPLVGIRAGMNELSLEATRLFLEFLISDGLTHKFQAINAVQIVESEQLYSQIGMITGLVYYPPELKRYLDGSLVCKQYIPLEALVAMMMRCQIAQTYTVKKSLPLLLEYVRALPEEQRALLRTLGTNCAGQSS